MSLSLFFGILIIAVVNFFVGCILGRRWLLEELEDEERQMRLNARMRAERLLADRNKEVQP